MSKVAQLFSDLNVINVGLEFFKQDIQKQQSPVTQVS